MRAWEIAVKDVKTVARDHKALATLIAMPAILIFILGSALGPLFSGGGTLIFFEVAFVDPGNTPLGTQLREVFGYDQIASMIALKPFETEEKAVDAVLSGAVKAAVILPQNGAGGTGGASQSITVRGDPRSVVSTGIVESIVDTFASQYSLIGAATSSIAGSVSQAVAEAGFSGQPGAGVPAPPQTEQLVSLIVGKVAERTRAATSVLRRTQLESNWITALQYYTAGMSSMFVLFGAAHGVKSIIDERDNHTMARLFASRVTKADILLGKTISTFLVCFLQLGVLVLFTGLILHVDWGGPPLAVLMVSAAMSFAATGFAMLVAAVARTERAADALQNIGIQVMALLGGCQVPVYIFPAALQTVSKFTLTRWGLQGFLGLMEGGGAGAAMTPVLVLCGMGVAFLGIGLSCMRLEQA